MEELYGIVYLLAGFALGCVAGFTLSKEWTTRPPLVRVREIFLPRKVLEKYLQMDIAEDLEEELMLYKRDMEPENDMNQGKGEES